MNLSLNLKANFVAPRAKAVDTNPTVSTTRVNNNFKLSAAAVNLLKLKEEGRKLVMFDLGSEQEVECGEETVMTRYIIGSTTGQGGVNVNVNNGSFNYSIIYNAMLLNVEDKTIVSTMALAKAGISEEFGAQSRLAPIHKVIYNVSLITEELDIEGMEDLIAVATTDRRIKEFV